MERPPLKKEKSMETTKPDTAIENDVLHLGSQSTLSAEAIAKAIAHHKRHHSGDQPQQAAAKASGGKEGQARQIRHRARPPFRQARGSAGRP